MNTHEAMQILHAELDNFREKPYSVLVPLIDNGPDRSENPGRLSRWLDRHCKHPNVTEGSRTGTSGVTYQFEIVVYWDDRPGGDVRVIGSIDDGGWRSFMPLTDSFIKNEANAFVGE